MIQSTAFMAISIDTIEIKLIPTAVLKALLIIICLDKTTVSKMMLEIIHSNLNKEYNLMSVAETLKKPAPRFHWKCKHTWRRSAKNTAWCLLGCSIGDFGTILYFQLTGIPWPTLYIMILAIINGIFTSIILETVVLSIQMIIIKAFKTAI